MNKDNKKKCLNEKLSMKALFKIYNKIEKFKKMEIRHSKNKKIKLLIQFIKIMFIANIAKECLPHVLLLLSSLLKLKFLVTAERHIPKCKNIFNRPKPP